MNKITFIAVLSFFIVFGCQSTIESTNSSQETSITNQTPLEPIVEKYWKLITLQGQKVTMTENQAREIYFMLKSNDNRVKGFAGCNSIMGSYELKEGNRIKFSQMGSTLMACPDEISNESDFMKVFELADNYTLVDDTLSLNIGRRAPLAVFEAVYF